MHICSVSQVNFTRLCQVSREQFWWHDHSGRFQNKIQIQFANTQKLFKSQNIQDRHICTDMTNITILRQGDTFHVDVLYTPECEDVPSCPLVCFRGNCTLKCEDVPSCTLVCFSGNCTPKFKEIKLIKLQTGAHKIKNNVHTWPYVPYEHNPTLLFYVCVTVHHWYNNINSQLDATITDFTDNSNQLTMFRAIISPILRSTRLCLHLVL